MSERRQSHRVSASSAQDDTARPILAPAPAPASQRGLSSSQTESFAGSRRPSLGHPRGLELPPLSRGNTANHDSTSPSATRIAGVASILNPTESDARPGQRRKLSQLESPIPSAQRLPPLAASVRNDQSAIGERGFSPQPPRRRLTPRSPSGLHRAASLGQLQPQPGIINAQRVPFPASPHRHTVQPGTSGAPPLPTPPARLQTAGYGFPFPAPQREADRRASTGTNRARNLSSSASPSTSYSSYSQAGQTSPVSRYAYHSGQRDASDLAGSESQRQMGIPISSSGGQNIYQMMTLETTSGTVQLPVDVQAASRVADEKRRRNAGASARFRQRRKEKEKEASTSIAKLEQQVKELAEESDFYRNDRANLLSVLRSVPGMEHHLQRPPSPQRLRRSSFSSNMTSRRTSYMRPPESETQSPETGRNVRRRTSTFSLPPPPGPPLQPNYTPGRYGTPIAPHPPVGALPPLTTPSQRQPSLGPPPAMQSHPQTGPYNPYSSRYPEPGSKEDR